MYSGIFSAEDIFIISLLSVARGGAAHPFANPAALQAAEGLTPQAPERLLLVSGIFNVIIFLTAYIYCGLALPILLQARSDFRVALAGRLRPVSSPGYGELILS